jgi:hypothetical protein
MTKTAGNEHAPLCWHCVPISPIPAPATTEAAAAAAAGAAAAAA